MTARVQEIFAFSQVDDESSDSSDDEIAVGPAWMNKFAQPASIQNATVAQAPMNQKSSGTTVSPNVLFTEEKNAEPAWMQKFGMNGSVNHFDNSATSLSSSTHFLRTDETPEWTQKLKRKGSLQGGGSMHGSQHGRTFQSTPSSLQREPQSPGVSGSTQPTVTPSTPSWVNQYRKASGNVTGAPSIPSVPSLNASNHDVATAAWRKSTFNNSVGSMKGESSIPHGSAPETPAWMRKFDTKKQADGFPKAPGLQNFHDDDDDQSVSSFASVQSATSVRSNIDPEWMLRFNKIKVGDSGSKQLPKVPTSTADVGGEPEWMKRFKEIGMSEENAPPKSRATVTKAGVPPRPPQSSANIPQGSFMSMSNHNRSNHPPGLPGMSSAPSSPYSARRAIPAQNFSGSTGGGMVSAPTSPVTAIGRPTSGSLHVFQPHGLPGTMQQRRQSLGSGSDVSHLGAPGATAPPVKMGDPAAMAPEKLDWMDKVKAVAKNSDEKPAWMQKLIQKKHGHDLPEEKKRSNKTPPWKQRERLKEEQAKQLRESLGLDLGVEEGEEDDEEDDLTDGSWGSGDESSVEEEVIPEWMRQFRKMDLKAARVVTAQGRAPQTVASLRTGSAKMTERTGDIVDDSQVVKAITVRSHSSRSLKLSRHSSFKNGKLKKDKSKRSVAASEDGSESSFGEQKAPTLATPGPGTNVLDQAPPVSIVRSSEHSAARLPDVDIIDKQKETNLLDYRSLHSTDMSVFSDQVEIDNSAPDGVMTKWGKTVNAKKPGNSTLMSWRMIQNQANKVKERIEKAKKGVCDGEESMRVDEDEGLAEKAHFDESATALFFNTADKKSSQASNSFRMDNSAAHLFGIGAGAGDKKEGNVESISMQNSAALLFGFESGAEAKADQRDSTKPWDVSGPINQEWAKNDDTKSDLAKGQGSLSKFLGGSKSSWPTDTVLESANDLDLHNDKEEENAKPSLSSYEPQSFVTTAAIAAPVVKREEKKKSFLNDSDSDDSDSDNDSVRNKKTSVENSIPVQKKVGEREPSLPPNAPDVTPVSIAPPQRKKSFLDDSDSDDDSSSDKSAPRRPLTKGRLYAPNKTESTIPLISGKSKDSDSEDSDDDCEYPSAEASRKAPHEEQFDAFPTSNSEILGFGGVEREENVITCAAGDGRTEDTGLTIDFASEMANKKAEASAAADPFGNFDQPEIEKEVPSASTDVSIDQKDTRDTNDCSQKPSEVKNNISKPPPKEPPPEKIDPLPADKREEEEWQAALMGLVAEEKKKQEEKEQWESSLLNLGAEFQDKSKLGSTPNKEHAPKNKAKPPKKEEKKKENDSSSKVNASRSLKQEEKKKEKQSKKPGDQKNKGEVSTKHDVPKPVKKEEKKKDDASSKEKKRNQHDGIDHKADKKPAKDSQKDSSKKDSKDKEKESRKRDLSKDSKRRSSVKESSSEKGLKASSSPSGSSKHTDSSRGRGDKPKSPKPSRSKSSDRRKRDKSKERISPKSKSSGKESFKAGLPPLNPSKAKSGSSPAKPKSMAVLSLKPKSSKNSTSKPKSSANLVIKPKSKVSLIPSQPKSKRSLIPTKPKSKKIAPTDFDDDDSFVMNDFDDDFSALPDFGDFAEDGSVIPLKAVRNPPSVKRGGKRSGSKADSKSKKKDKSSIKDSSKAGKSSGGKSKDKKSDKKSEKKSDKKKSKKK